MYSYSASSTDSKRAMVVLYKEGEKIAETLAPIAIRAIKKWVQAEAERHNKTTKPENTHYQSFSATGTVHV